jgi:endonuclease-3 related protein
MRATIESTRPLLPRWRRIPGPPRDATKARLLRLYLALRRRFGPRRRWPGRPYAVALAALLTPRRAEADAARAIARLRARGWLAPRRLAGASAAALTAVLGGAGADREEVAGLRAFTRWLVERFGGRMRGLRTPALAPLRRELSAVPGVGAEAADAILLHAAGRPVVAVDGHVRRVLARHRLLPRGASAEATRLWLEAHLPSDPSLLAELHALLVQVGVDHCRAVPLCARCPLRFDLRGSAYVGGLGGPPKPPALGRPRRSRGSPRGHARSRPVEGS